MTPTLTADAAAYHEAVGRALADLPDDDRAELLEDVEQHLAELAAEDPAPLEARLGPPEAYADELRSAAGLPPRDADTTSSGNGLRATLARARTAGDRLAATRAYREVAAFAPELRPAWWVARAYLAVVAVALAQRTTLHDVLPVPRVFGSGVVGLALVAGAAVLSVRIGRRRPFRGWGRALVVAANVAALLSAVTLANVLQDRVAGGYYYVTQETYPPALHGPYGRVRNIFPYDAQGRPLQDVQLFDQDGRPIAEMVCNDVCLFDVRPSQRPGFPLPKVYEDETSGTVIPYAPGLHATPDVVTPAPPTPTTAPTPTPTPTPVKPTR